LEKILIAAVSKNNVIGFNGKLPWYSVEEIMHFKNTTIGCPVLMGKKTWESIGKPLENRINIIITANKFFRPAFDNLIIQYSLFDAIDFCEQKGFEKIFIIGGGKIFEQAILLADKIILSRMNFETDGDVFFPEIKNEIWKEISAEKFTDFTVHCYIRK
jgi:dihydrofolate reductase